MKKRKMILFTGVILISLISLNYRSSIEITQAYEKEKKLDNSFVIKTKNNLVDNDLFSRIGSSRNGHMRSFLKDIYDKKMLIENEKDILEVTNDKPVELDYDEVFKKDIFLGDSITSGMSCYGVLDDNLVITKTGMHVYESLNQIDKIVSKNPENIYIHLGINDIDRSFTSDIYGGYYLKLVQQLKEKLPNSNIYIQSILPVSPTATKSKSVLNNEYIQEYNNELIVIAEKENVTYLKIEEVIEGEGNSIYAKDGIHFKESFYYKWLDYIIENCKTI